MNNLEKFKMWIKSAKVSEKTKKELKDLTDPMEIKDRFYKNLEFGTGGVMGVIGAGTNRMNIYTVSKATQGYSEYLNKHFENPSIAIAYDSRNM